MWPRRIQRIALVSIGLTVLPATALQGQRPDSTALERLRARAPLIAPDTARVDTLAVPDSLTPPPPQLVEIEGDSARRTPQQGIGLANEDSVARQLMRLSGYVATEYSAPYARYDADSATLRLAGASAVAREGQVLNADSSIVYYENTGFACGFGAPQLTGEGMDAPIASDSLCYDVERGIGRGYGVATSVTESATWYVQGQCWTVGERLYCHDTMFTDCDLEEPHPHYHFRAADVKIVRGNVLVARDVTLNFADVPVFWLPVMMQSLERGRRSGILFPEFGIGDIARTSSGYNRRISNVGAFWAINDYMGMRLSGGWEANNHTSAELGFEYNMLRRFLQGGITINRYWMNDGGRNLAFRTTNSWRPDERTNVSLSASYASSSAFVRDRSYDPAELNRSIDSDANLSRRFDWGSVSLGGSRQQTLHDETVQWTLPGATVSLPTVTFFEAGPGQESWYSNMTWSGTGRFNARRTDIADANPDLRQSTRVYDTSASHRMQLGAFGLSQSIDFTQDERLGRNVQRDDTTLVELQDSTNRTLDWQTSLSFQQRLFAKTTITPNVSINGSTVTRGDRQVARPLRISMGASLGTDLYGFFPGFGPFERLRHRISPTFSYTYSPRPTITDEQRDFFGLTETGLRENNALTINLNQTFEAKYRTDPEAEAEGGAEAAAEPGAEQEAGADTTSGPRRMEQADIITLLSINTSAVTYDFVRAREEDDPLEGLTQTTLNNTLSTDLLSNFSIRISHDLFERAPVGEGAPEGEVGERRFRPFLTGASFGFRLDSDSWIARTLGIGRSVDAEPEVKADSTVGPGGDDLPRGDIQDWNQDGPDAGVIGPSGQDPSQRPSPQDEQVGTWNASFDYVLSRRRPIRNVDGTLDESDASQTVRGTFRMQPTRYWALSWRTGYDFTDGEFSDHVLTLTRRLHDFDANFDFIKSQNGNFLFMFRVQLRASPDLKVDYTQRDLNQASQF